MCSVKIYGTDPAAIATQIAEVALSADEALKATGAAHVTIIKATKKKRK